MSRRNLDTGNPENGEGRIACSGDRSPGRGRSTCTTEQVYLRLLTMEWRAELAGRSSASFILAPVFRFSEHVFRVVLARPRSQGTAQKETAMQIRSSGPTCMTGIETGKKWSRALHMLVWLGPFTVYASLLALGGPASRWRALAPALALAPCAGSIELATTAQRTRMDGPLAFSPSPLTNPACRCSCAFGRLLDAHSFSSSWRE